MSLWILLITSLAGGLGAVLRLVFDDRVQLFLRGRAERSGRASRYPWGITVINVSGSFLLGLVTGLALATVVPVDLRIITGSGFLGGYTTFSTTSLDTVRLVQARHYGAALANGLGQLVAAVAASALGLTIALVAAGAL